MKLWAHVTKMVLVFAVGLCVLTLAPSVHAQQTVDHDAQSVLDAMSKYLGV